MNRTKVLKLPETFLFWTSGSNGLPRQLELLKQHIDREVEYLPELFASRRRIQSLLPSHHIYGYIWTVLLAARLEIEVIPGADFQPGNLVIGHSNSWRTFSGQTMPMDHWTLSSGGPIQVANLSLPMWRRHYVAARECWL